MHVEMSNDIIPLIYQKFRLLSIETTAPQIRVFSIMMLICEDKTIIGQQARQLIDQLGTSNIKSYTRDNKVIGYLDCYIEQTYRHYNPVVPVYTEKVVAVFNSYTLDNHGHPRHMKIHDELTLDITDPKMFDTITEKFGIIEKCIRQKYKDRRKIPHRVI